MPRFKGPQQALNILKQLGEAERSALIENIAKKDPELAHFLKENMVQMEDLIHLTPQMIAELLRSVSVETIGLAFRTVSRELVEHFTENISRNNKEEILYIYQGPPKPLSQVNEAKDQVMKVVLELMDKGKIVINPHGKDELV